MSCVARGGGDPAALAKEMGFEALGADSLSAVVAEVIAASPDEWKRYVEGDDKLTAFFTGGVMKATKGQANGAERGGRAPAAAGLIAARLLSWLRLRRGNPPTSLVP